ncbi:hypothetical protein FNH22_17350, partial [Fulvivirga sp. M361]
MNNHIHLIAAALEDYNLSDILRDLKKHTSKTLLERIKGNLQESRRKWMLWLFQSAGKRNSNNTHYQFWQQDNRPTELSTNTMMDQRLDYIHDNPVKEGLVYEPEVSIRRTAYFKVGLNPVILRDEKTRRFKDARALRRVAAIGQE